MGIEWDPVKDRENRRQHKIRFADAAAVFEDERALTMPDPEHSGDEDRYVVLGQDVHERVLFVSFTWRGDTIRLISARKATPGLRRQYEEG